MTPDIPAAPDLRAVEIRQLIDKARRDGEVSLTPLTAIQLCVLGGPKHPYMDASIAHAWSRLRPRWQEAAVGVFTEDLVEKGLLRRERRPDGSPAYSLSPELGIILAARCRPGFIITNEIPGVAPYQPALFALGDEQDPAQAIVAEVPAALSERTSRPRAPEPLRVIFAYMLFSTDGAADFLARYTINPPEVPGVRPGAPRVVTRVHPRDEHGTIGFRVSVLGDGTRARVGIDSWDPTEEYSMDGLRAVMLRLITGAFNDA